MKTTIAVVQTKSYKKEEKKKEVKHLEQCLHHIDEAVGKGANIICFPEFYPGPAYLEIEEFDPTKTLCEKAKENGVYLIVGELEKARKEDYYSTLKLIGPEGKIVGKYRRVQVPPREVNLGLVGKDIIPGQGPLEVYDTEFGKIGLLACSEIHWPELCRVLAIKGAEIIFIPVGGIIYEVYNTWKHLIWARAIENQAYIATCQNLYGMEDGIATIAGPEEILAVSKREGVLTATLDLDRIKWLRTQEQESFALPFPFKALPCLLKNRRPELYRELSRAPKSG